MKKLQPSEWPSHATKTFPLRGTVFQKGCPYNWERDSPVSEADENKDWKEKIFFIVIFILFAVLGYIIL